MTTIRATKVWAEGPLKADGVAVHVESLCSYRLIFRKNDCHIIAPGKDQFIELDPEVYPVDEPEECAIMIVAQLEGGIEL